MASIYFVSTYPPTMCGIADYTYFLDREIPDAHGGILAFNPERKDVPNTEINSENNCHIWYGIPSIFAYSAKLIHDGLRELGANRNSAVLWIQHENGIWRDNDSFITMLKDLDIPKIVTFHSLQFQSGETPTGLCQNQYELLRDVLPQVAAITGFSDGVFQAVTAAFPQYEDKVYIMNHGIHSYPGISRLSRKEAKDGLNDYLLYESDLDKSTKETLHRQHIFTDSDTIVLGQTGFLCPNKNTEALYSMRFKLENVIPHKRIAAVRIGTPRNSYQKAYADQLRKQENGRPKILLETWLPPEILPLAQRAFDINFYWPNDCTQSGVMAHALGTGAVIAGRDLEGVGETLKEAGQLASRHISHLLYKIRDLILQPELAEKVEKETLVYAAEYSWKNQARRHCQLAEHVLHEVSRPVACSPLTIRTEQSAEEVGLYSSVR